MIPPIPVLLHVWEDDLGRLWTYSLISDPEWEPNIPIERNRQREWSNRTFEMVIEVLDLEAGEAIAQVHRERLGYMCGSPLLYDVLEGGMGETQVQVLEPMLLGADEGEEH